MRFSSVRFFRTVIVFLLALFLPVTMTAKTIYQKELRPFLPRVMSQGGQVIASGDGYQSLFSNPAGLAMVEGRQWTTPSVTTWVHSAPKLLFSTLSSLSGDDLGEDSQDEKVLDALKEQFTTNGFGLGAAVGFAYTGHGFGIGLNVIADSYLYGKTFPLGLEGEIEMQVGASVGYAYPFHVGPVTIAVGTTVRPHVRVTSLVDSEAAARLVSTFMGADTGTEDDENITKSIYALNGWGVGLDLGVLTRWRSLSLGIQARDVLSTQMRYAYNSLYEIFDALLQDVSLPAAAEEGEPGYVSNTYRVPVEFGFALAWHPDLDRISYFFDPTLHVSLVDPFGLTDQPGDPPRSMWNRVHVGSEMRFLRFIDLRVGLNQGYFTFGTGLDLLFMELNFALYGRELGFYPGDRQVGGAAVEIAFRY